MTDVSEQEDGADGHGGDRIAEEGVFNTPAQQSLAERAAEATEDNEGEEVNLLANPPMENNSQQSRCCSRKPLRLQLGPMVRIAWQLPTTLWLS